MRDTYWDMIKGIAIIAVIVIHSCVTTNLTPSSDGALNIIAIRAIVNFAVPVFFALSGFLNGSSRTPKDLRWIHRRLVAIIPAYLIWTVIFVALFERSHFTRPELLLKDIVTGSGIGIGYFVIVLAQFTIMTPILGRIRSLWIHVAAISALTVAGVSYTYFIQINSIQPLSQFPYGAILFPVWYPFYHVGFLAGQRGWLKDKGNTASIAVAAIAVFVLFLVSIFESLALRWISFEFALSQLKASAFLYSAAICVLILLLHSRAAHFRVPGLIVLGQNSYVIYLGHLIVLRVTAKIAEAIGLVPGQLLYVAFVASLVLGVCFLGVLIGRRLLPERAQKWIMG